MSGSLREQFSNSRLLSAAAVCMPDCVAELLHFNPELDPAENSVVAAWISQMKAADGLIVSRPEYARGLPGISQKCV
ncbi:MAG: chromate reductase [Candidatus Azotimanducaceae bacterium]|jgi:chromate reductase